MNLLQENKVISLKKKYPEIKLEDAILRTTHLTKHYYNNDEIKRLFNLPNYSLLESSKSSKSSKSSRLSPISDMSSVSFNYSSSSDKNKKKPRKIFTITDVKPKKNFIITDVKPKKNFIITDVEKPKNTGYITRVEGSLRPKTRRTRKFFLIDP